VRLGASPARLVESLPILMSSPLALRAGGSSDRVRLGGTPAGVGPEERSHTLRPPCPLRSRVTATWSSSSERAGPKTYALALALLMGRGELAAEARMNSRGGSLPRRSWSLQVQGLTVTGAGLGGDRRLLEAGLPDSQSELTAQLTTERLMMGRRAPVGASGCPLTELSERPKNGVASIEKQH